MTARGELAGASVRVAGRSVLEAASLHIEPGEMVGVVGPNGAGKTTLLRALLGLAPLAAGQALLGGRPVSGLSDAERAALAAYMPQERRVAWSLPAWRIAALGAVDRPAGLARAAALEGLARVGLAELCERGVLDMSGGERARVLLARLLITRAPLLVADEPTAGLDPDAQFLALEQLRLEARAGRSVLVTLHDLTLAARTCDRLVVLAEHHVLADAAPSEALSPEILARAFQLEGALVDTPAGPTLAARRLHPGRS
ncbi:ABC transporter ATP-binding protein [Phenylobacterium montanum]|uniref:ABC transporter ATP-binding protein n=1 Tax=Phenylobacterium montanum TaxID=2823693 RepID=A0A975G0U6_9CAUL|nr:ABC transporter ATP-binding protein [Caulobacter sp. S6]QUD89038.1 ABC transporter ATP-binding protein [Caulobacter sp. S6]